MSATLYRREHRVGPRPSTYTHDQAICTGTRGPQLTIYSQVTAAWRDPSARCVGREHGSALLRTSRRLAADAAQGQLIASNGQAADQEAHCD